MDDNSKLKGLIKRDRTALRLFIQLLDRYRSGSDPQLTTKDSIVLMVGLLRLLSREVESHFGTSEWKPDGLKFAQFMDTIGDMTIAEFLGIRDMGELPEAGIEARADAIRDTGIEKREDPPSPQLSSRMRRPSSLAERLIQSPTVLAFNGAARSVDVERRRSLEWLLGEALGRLDKESNQLSLKDAGFPFTGLQRTRFLTAYKEGSQ